MLHDSVTAACDCFCLFHYARVFMVLNHQSHAALAHSKGGAGFITKINSDLDACFVKWDLTEEECGWYRCGAYGHYTLLLLPPSEEKPFQVTDMMTTGGNSRKDIENRNMDYREKHGLNADNIFVSLSDMLGL